MKLWERNQKISKPQRASVDNMMDVLRQSFAARPKYWQTLGANARRICQFRYTDGRSQDWYLEIDAQGGRVNMGRAPRCDMEFSSSTKDFLRLFNGQAGQELFASGRVAMRGQPMLLAEVFKAVR